MVSRQQDDLAIRGTNQLDVVLAGFGMLEAGDREKARDLCWPQHFPKGAYLHRSGEIADKVFFIVTGLVRFFYTTQDGKEHNKSFSSEHQFAGALQSELNPQPSRFYVQTLEPMEVLALSLGDH